MTTEKKLFITKQELYDMYWNQKLDMKQIARYSSVHWTTILSKMEDYNIPRRNRKEVQILALSRPEIKQKLSERTKQYWQNPEYRELKIEQARNKHN